MDEEIFTPFPNSFPMDKEFMSHLEREWDLVNTYLPVRQRRRALSLFSCCMVMRALSDWASACSSFFSISGQAPATKESFVILYPWFLSLAISPSREENRFPYR